MMLTHQRGLPSVGEVFLFMVGEVFLFMIGAIAGLAVLGLIVSMTGTAPFEPSFGDLRRTGMIHRSRSAERLAGQRSSR
jgi:hypothetical protein